MISSKKAMEISPPSLVVTIVLLLMVLLILLFILGGQTGSFVESITKIKEGIFGVRCETPAMGRVCETNLNPDYECGEVVMPPSEGWVDCQNSDCCKPVKKET